MKPYRSISARTGRHSGVTAYEQDATSIRVRFAGGAIYRYTYQSCGRAQVELMKQLAAQQQGLSTYIAREQPAYESIS